MTSSSRRCSTAALTGQQFRSPTTEPYYVLFEDFTHVKFYRRSFRAAIELAGRSTASAMSTTGSRSGWPRDRPEPPAPVNEPPVGAVMDLTGLETEAREGTAPTIELA